MCIPCLVGYKFSFSVDSFVDKLGIMHNEDRNKLIAKSKNSAVDRLSKPIIHVHAA